VNLVRALAQAEALEKFVLGEYDGLAGGAQAPRLTQFVGKSAALG
jgi:hypothetical protein